MQAAALEQGVQDEGLQRGTRGRGRCGGEFRGVGGDQATGPAIYQYGGAVRVFAVCICAVCICEERVDTSGRSSGGEQGRDGMAAQHDLVIPVYSYGLGGR